MAASHYVRSLAYKKVPHFAALNPFALKAYAPNLILWGGAVTFGLFTFTERVPIFQTTFYQKIPVIGSYWIHEIDPQDSPQ